MDLLFSFRLTEVLNLGAAFLKPKAAAMKQKNTTNLNILAIGDM
jgi:hypothetical protein